MTLVNHLDREFLDSGVCAERNVAQMILPPAMKREAETNQVAALRRAIGGEFAVGLRLRRIPLFI
jgi:hypothetical protein